MAAKTHHDNADDWTRYAIGLCGDLPYSSVQATVGVTNLIADMNSQNLAFTAHDGDLKSGSNECTDEVYRQGLAYFNALVAPAVFTPGDNDWVDCDRTPGYSSLAQLDKEQTTPLCVGFSGNVPCVENRRWTLGGVTSREREQRRPLAQGVGRWVQQRSFCLPGATRSRKSHLLFRLFWLQRRTTTCRKQGARWLITGPSLLLRERTT